MNLKTKVIASEISNLTDARYFAAWGVDYLSYVIDATDDQFIGIESIKEIKEWVEGPKSLGSLNGISLPDSLDNVYEQLQLDGLIISPFTVMEGLSDNYTRVYKTVTQIENSDAFSEDFLIARLSKKDNIHDIKDKLALVAKSNELYIDGIFSLEEIEIILSEINPTGIVLKGGEEEKVGFKSFDELDEIFEHLEVF